MTIDKNYGLNPEPTAAQWALYRRHRDAGTSPGNPKWYKDPSIKPFVFVPDKAPRYPRLPSGAEWHKRYVKANGLEAPDPFHAARGKEADPSAYVAAYEAAAGLRHA